MNQKQIIKKYLGAENDWVMEGKIRSINTPWGFIGFRGDRNCRQMVADGELEHKMIGKYAYVRVKSQVEYLPRIKKECNHRYLEGVNQCILCGKYYYARPAKVSVMPLTSRSARLF